MSVQDKSNKNKAKFDEINAYKQRKSSSYSKTARSGFACISPRSRALPLDTGDESMSELILDPASAQNSVISYMNSKPLFMGICGGSGSGKTFISKWMMKHFAKTSIKICVLKEKSFLKNLDISGELDKEAFIQNYDFENPNAVDWDLFERAALELHKRKPFTMPVYDLFDSKRVLATRKIEPGDIVIVEGRLIYTSEKLRNLCTVKVFLDTDVDIMLSRRVFKGLARNLELDFVIERYMRYVKPNYESHIEPSKVYADLVVNNFGGQNYSIEDFETNYEILAILQDLLKFRLKDKNYEAFLVNEKMSMLAKRFEADFD